MTSGLFWAVFIFSIAMLTQAQAEIQVPSGYKAEIIASGLIGPANVVANDRDELFVAESGKKRILKITPDGTVSVFAKSTQSAPLDFWYSYWTTPSYPYPTKMDFDTNGYLYVEVPGDYNDPYNPYGDVLDTLYRISPSGVVEKIARQWLGRNVFYDIAGLTFGPDGYLYMGDSSYHDILKVNTVAKTSTVFASNVFAPYDLLFDNQGNLYAAMAATSTDKIKIYRFTPDGIRTLYSDAFLGPVAMAWGPEGFLYVMDLSAGTIYTLDPVTKAISTFATGFNYVYDIDFDSQGNLYVVECLLGQIVKISKEVIPFTNVRLIDTIPTQAVEFVLSSATKVPYSVASDGDKTVVEWRFDNFKIDQMETISFDLNLYNLIPGENRLVDHKLELIYTDKSGQEITISLPPLYVDVLASAFDGMISANKSVYEANEDVIIGASITNLSGYSRNIDAKVLIEDSQGVLVKEVTTLANLNFNAEETKNFDNLTYSIGSTISGGYRAHLILYENQQPVGEAFTNFKIQPTIALTSKVMTNKISYFANEPVIITSTIQSTSTNYIFENLNATVAISSQQSANSLYTETQTIPILLPGQQTELKTYWNISTNPPGVYPVTLEVKDASGTVISTSTANITITDAIKPSKLLKGQITVDKQSLLQGEPVVITYTVTNVGNIDFPQIDLSILTVHVVELTAYDTLTDQTSLQMGTTYTNTRTLNTNNYSAKDYLVILRASVLGVEETLSGTYFRVEGAPSAPSLNSPEHGEDIETLTPLLSVNNASDPNDDKLTYEFELYTDSNLSNLLTSSGMLPEGSNVTSWQVPIELQENGVYYWRARAYDGRLYGEWMLPATFRVNLTNEPPTAPTLSSPADNSEVSTLTPILTINNASDPDSSNLTYNFKLALDVNFTQIVTSQIGIFEGVGITSWQVPINLTENTYYYWRAQADDWFIEGPWMTTAMFFVNRANDAPTTPSILYPSNNTEITTLNTDVIASNSEDPDSTTLTYIFEIDTVMTFDSPNVIRSGNIPTTSWHIEGLNDNTYYYIRAKASDGLAESQWSEVVSFFVNTTNDVPTTPVLANPSDGSGVNTFTPVLSIHNSTDIDRDVLTYEFEINEDASMTNLVASITGIEEAPQITSWTVPVTLKENKTYYWRARAFDGELHSGWMPLASFMVNTANDAPGAPSLHLPANGSSLDTLYPTLSVYNAIDPDSDSLTYDFEIYSNGTLIKSITGIPQDISGTTSITLNTALTDNTTYNWRARGYDGDRYGAWMDMATFSIHLPVTNITATIDFDPNTLDKKSNGNWVTVYIELPAGYNVNNIIISSIRLQGTIHAESWPYCIGDNDSVGIQDLMVKFKRADVINILPNGDNVQILVTGTVGTTTFEGVDTIRVIK